MLHYLPSRFFRKGFDLNCDTEIYLIPVVFLVSTRVIKIGRGFLPLIANILFVSINFTLEKVFVTFFRPNELQK